MRILSKKNLPKTDSYKKILFKSRKLEIFTNILCHKSEYFQHKCILAIKKRAYKSAILNILIITDQLNGHLYLNFENYQVP